MTIAPLCLQAILGGPGALTAEQENVALEASDSRNVCERGVIVNSGVPAWKNGNVALVNYGFRSGNGNEE